MGDHSLVMIGVHWIGNTPQQFTVMLVAKLTLINIGKSRKVTNGFGEKLYSSIFWKNFYRRFIAPQ